MYLLQEREVWVLKMSRNQETTTWPHWLSLLLEQTVWCCSYAGHKSLQNLNRGCKVLQNPSKATAVTRNPPFSLFVIVSVRCTVFGSTELHCTPKKILQMQTIFVHYFQMAVFCAAWPKLEMWEENRLILTPGSFGESWHAATSISAWSWGVHGLSNSLK